MTELLLLAYCLPITLWTTVFSCTAVMAVSRLLTQQDVVVDLAWEEMLKHRDANFLLLEITD